ncbi:glycine cleavage system protein GcvH [Mucilaginibacter auburnensis]|uniref:Glycine cleavage system H protein n=1 Tax=Mucilaginibacter auburnensis TaxID=1457233 RepID=A0A2H9VWA5_9SPHI|nr:glycine cleavage system protein GcvH [Mucilaginibacter auburnensis]PJJ85096.1 glycine cleavage system H protein [Mucilaginibacter auburnensis]
MDFPSELKYTKDHEWIKASGDEAYIGITAFAQQELGDIVYVEIDKIGAEVAAEEVFGTIEAVKTVSDLFMPVAAIVIEMNKKLDANPELINTDPYGDGWIIKVKLTDLTQLDSLLWDTEYKTLIGL